jgi:Asp-tRNA(Asn)/Glu-tRNA(Gln) amidotransferase A subunit family amidase
VVGHGGSRGSLVAAPVYKPQPICAVIVGALFNDDKILSVAHRFQQATDVHLKHPAL